MSRHKKREKHDEREEVKVLREIEEDLDELVAQGKRRRLSFIKIRFGGHHMLGPVTLTVGQKTTATVQGFDQNGAPFAIDFTANPVTWTLDNTTFDSSNPQPDQSDLVESLAAGVANLSASCASLSDSETVTNVAQAPVLSSIKIDFSTPA
jgi:hypothetical protein